MNRQNQRYDLPEDVIAQQRNHPLLNRLYICRTGEESTGNKLTYYRDRGVKDSHSLIYCNVGKGWFESDKKRWTIQPGQALFVLQNQPHAYGPLSDIPWGGYWVYFNGLDATALLEWLNISAENPVLTVGKSLQIERLFRELLAFCQLGYGENYLVNSAAVVRQILGQVRLAQTKRQNFQHQLDAEQSVQFMLANLGEKISLAQLAQQASLSTTHFAMQFQKQMGYAPIDYFIRLKMQKASELLSTTDNSIKDIGRQLGYNDPFYFSRIFKKVIGVSPRAYRQVNRFGF